MPENDSDGEFAFAATELWRYSGDEKTARVLWPHVAAAIAHMESLRASERIDANRAGERAAYFGLMPPSISHEGYSDKAAYSYWDDFWAYTGYRSAVELATGLGLVATRRAWPRSAMSFSLTCRRRLRRAPPASASTSCPGPRTAATSIRPRAPSR